MVRWLFGTIFIIGAVNWAPAQHVADYDPVLEPYPVKSQQFCDAAPECARMRAMDPNGNYVKVGRGR